MALNWDEIRKKNGVGGTSVSSGGTTTSTGINWDEVRRKNATTSTATQQTAPLGNVGEFRKLDEESRQKSKPNLVKLSQGAQQAMVNAPALTPIDQRINLFPNNEKADDRKYIGANLIPAYKEDKPLTKIGKGIVNYGVGGALSLLGNVGGAPQQAMMQTSRAGTNLILGKPQQTTEMSFGKDLLGAKEDNLLTQAAATALDPTTYVLGGVVDDLARAGIVGKASKPSTEMVRVLGESQQKVLAKMKGALKGIAESADEVIPLEKVRTVKPSTKQGTFKIKNTAYDDVAREYNDAIEAIQNHFRTNELRIDEIPLIKSELGIDLDDIINRMEQAEKGVQLPGADAMRLKRTAGAASDRAYDIGQKSATGRLNVVKAADDVPLSGALADGRIDVMAPRKTPGIPAGGKPRGGIPEGMKERSFPRTVVESDTTAPEVAQGLKQNMPQYITAPDLPALERARQAISADPDEALRRVKSNEPATKDLNAIAQLLMQKAQNEGRWQDAIDIVEITAAKATEQGQAIQALSMWARLTPEGMLKYANKVAKEAGTALTPEDAKIITEGMKKAAAAEGREAAVETAKVLDHIASKVPVNMAQKISSLQTMAQLLNPKTAIRNIGGNVAFAAAENLSNTLAAGIDKAASLFTGKRTVALPSIKTQAKGFGKGFKLGLEDAVKGIDTSGLKSQFDLPTTTFRKGPLSTLEKAMNIELKATDRAFYQAAYEDSLRQQMKAAKVTAPTQEMIENAHLDGLYRTFQDNNVATKAFTTIKRGLNYIGIGNEKSRFGLGDILLKYPKTPANLLMRGIDYSPVGIVKSIVDFARKGQRAGAMSLSRGIVGTSIIGASIVLYDLGILTGKQDKDKDVNSLRQATGGGGYRLNLSALKRYVLSGFDPSEAKAQQGDSIMNYDWAQPMSIPMAAGANIGQKKEAKTGDILSAVATALEGGVSTLAEQPLLQGLTQTFQGYDPVQSLLYMAQGVPASFTPAILNQVRQMKDPLSRVTKSDNFGQAMLNRVMNRLPGLSERLQPRINTLGQEQKTYQNNNFFNVFLNPAFSSKYQTDPTVQEILNVYEKSGDKTHFPRVANDKFSFNKQEYQLTPEEYTAFQKSLGQNTMRLFKEFMAKPEYQSMDYAERAKKLAGIITDAQDIARFQILKGRGLSDNIEIMKAPSTLTYNKQEVELTFEQRKKYADLVAKYKKELLKSAEGQKSYKERQQEWDELIERKAREAAAKQIKIDIFRK
jgi:hypothetical protein